MFSSQSLIIHSVGLWLGDIGTRKCCCSRWTGRVLLEGSLKKTQHFSFWELIIIHACVQNDIYNRICVAVTHCSERIEIVYILSTEDWLKPQKQGLCSHKGGGSSWCTYWQQTSGYIVKEKKWGGGVKKVGLGWESCPKLSMLQLWWSLPDHWGFHGKNCSLVPCSLAMAKPYTTHHLA